MSIFSRKPHNNNNLPVTKSDEDPEYQQWYDALSPEMQEYEASYQAETFAETPSFFERLARRKEDRRYYGG